MAEPGYPEQPGHREIVDACHPTPEIDLLDDSTATTGAELFKALADPTRLRLLHYIADAPDGTACSCHLPDALGISQPTMSHHLKKLVQAGLINRAQRGRWAHYTLNPTALAHAHQILAPPVRVR